MNQKLREAVLLFVEERYINSRYVRNKMELMGTFHGKDEVLAANLQLAHRSGCRTLHEAHCFLYEKNAKKDNGRQTNNRVELDSDWAKSYELKHKRRWAGDEDG